MVSLGLAQRIKIGLDGNSGVEFPMMGRAARLNYGRRRVGFRIMASEGQSVEPDLSVTVNGLKMPNPFVIGSGPPGTSYTVKKRAFDEGWGGVIAKTPARLALNQGCEGVSAINTIMSVMGINLDTLRPEPCVEGYSTPGGYSAKAVHPIALAKVCTGVMMHGYGLVKTLCSELKVLMRKHNFSSIEDFSLYAVSLSLFNTHPRRH